MIIIKIDCCGCPQTLCGLSIWMSADAMWAKGLRNVLIIAKAFKALGTVWGALATAGLVVSVFQVSSLQAGDCTSISKPARHNIQHISQLGIGTRIQFSLLY